ncbi:MAG: RnfABCDGE type electron transport complex subunit B [Candidatus Margulisbacteria bacterium]|nr:RnfABCDGE type electron transport complex subunit B [Candidatus Margulisiibacteriota bacterium]
MIFTAIIVLGILGFIFAGALGLAADYFKVEEDPRLGPIVAILPGTNCGACGSASCHNFAEKLIKGEVQISGCVAGGPGVASALAKVMGVEEPTAAHKKVAAVHCGAKEGQRKRKANYAGVKSCAAADMVGGGGLMCGYGCLGYGDCYCVCPFDAIRMKDGLPVIDPDKCTSCGKCVDACPRKIISIIPHDFNVIVACSSRDSGAVTRKNCPVGCIACKICEREAPNVFKVIDNLAVMDYSRTDADCSAAIEKCPTKCIVIIGKK